MHGVDSGDPDGPAAVKRRSSWERASPEAKARAQTKKAVDRKARYRYIRTVIGAPAWKAQAGQHSVLAMRCLFPDHDFPAHIVAIGKPGRKRRPIVE
jgi:hypothetical protein